MFKVYIIKNIDGIYYKGITSNLDKRVEEHNTNMSRYTSGKGPWVLVYEKEYVNKRDALIEEKRIKRLNVKSIEKMIELG
jgi:putative endonuclease